MAIVATDIDYYLTVNTGPGLSTAQPATTDSHGAYLSSTATGLAKNDMWDNVTGDENAASDVEYRAIGVVNNHATLTLQNAVAWVASEVAGGTNMAIGLAPEGVVSATSATAQCQRTTNEGTAPTGVTFSTPTTKAGGLAIGNIPPGSAQVIWVRRTATASGAVNDDGATIRVSGDTAA